jgi:hypothetical protein
MSETFHNSNNNQIDESNVTLKLLPSIMMVSNYLKSVYYIIKLRSARLELLFTRRLNNDDNIKKKSEITDSQIHIIQGYSLKSTSRTTVTCTQITFL